ncbi:MAG: 1-deoxy-D-xylulose-5-phosphate reductoisomerase [SAR324 cluster bacterium]|nr:1-deoxy-D-xylulose-5-phosphate reductoisomerase [SAR324 cluster bacterium]
MIKKNLAVLGSTGSIGVNTLDVVRQFPDRFKVIGLSCQNQVETMIDQIEEFHPRIVSVGSETAARGLRERYPEPQLKVFWGQDGLERIATEPEVELVVAGIVGAAGLKSSHAALSVGKTLALANKETMVLAGDVMVATARQHGSRILPVDSEHNAVFQALAGHNPQEIEKIILTASGGPFRDRPVETFENITLEEALNHPNWKMGSKITIDSASMMNKGLEVIEARWLFDVSVDKIEVIIHRQSIIHSMVEYQDGSFIAQMGLPDMRVPIAYCLSWPERLPLKIPKMNLSQIAKLQFEQVSGKKFPCLALAFKAARLGGGAPAILNGANEEVVARLLDRQIRFVDIARVLSQVMVQLEQQHHHREAPAFLKKINTVDDALQADAWGRHQAHLVLEKLK